MKRFILAVVIVVLFVFFSLFYQRIEILVASTDRQGIVSATSTRVSTPAVSADPPTSHTYKDGTYIGSVADAQWGNIQVQAVIEQGKITKITFLQFPNERGRSIMINNFADPRLSSEAIQAQSATVDIVTGATDSSEAFMQSLADALAQAVA